MNHTNFGLTDVTRCRSNLHAVIRTRITVSLAQVLTTNECGNGSSGKLKCFRNIQANLGYRTVNCCCTFRTVRNLGVDGIRCWWHHYYDYRSLTDIRVLVITSGNTDFSPARVILIRSQGYALVTVSNGSRNTCSLFTDIHSTYAIWHIQ